MKRSHTTVCEAGNVNLNIIKASPVITLFASLLLASYSAIAAPPDDDLDGIANNKDNCPLIANPDQADVDGDGIGDVCEDFDGDGIIDTVDPDDDNDGVLDVDDAFPFDPAETVDTDNDGIGNNADTDDDNDGVLDVNDAFPLDPTETIDTDNDGIGNNADTDDDNDGVLDVNDAFPLDPTENLDTDNDGIGNNADTDDDNDGVLDVNDAFPLDPTETIDTDNDGIGNNADTDDDNDGVLDVNDAFPLDPTETIDSDGDGIGNNADLDDDNDGMPDSFEIANGLDPLDANDASLDADGDGYSNLTEFLVGTDPQDANDSPQYIELQKLLASDGAASDEFGLKLSVSNDTALIGARYDDDNGGNSGSAYVYVRDVNNNWVQQAKLVASDGAAGGNFGGDVSISGDTALIGASGDAGNGLSSGSAYVFVRNAGGNWSQQAKLNANDSVDNDLFGITVSLDGDTALIGATGDSDNGSSSGSAYVFVRDGGGSWTQQAKLLASDGAAYDYFGNSLALSVDTVLIGAYGDDDNNGSRSGSAYVYVRDAGGTWSQQAKLTADDARAEDRFSFNSVALSGDTALIGALLETNENGSSAGSAYVYERDISGIWTQQAKLIANDGVGGDWFGSSVSLSSNAALVGAIHDDDDGASSGSAYLFVRDASGSLTQSTKIHTSDSVAYDNFGKSVSLSGDMALIGATGDDDNGSGSGSAYLFNLFDTDTIPYTEDNCPFAANQNQLDSDADGAGDVCDAFPLDPAESLDTDIDGIGNNADTDDDGDGLLDTEEDINGNGLVDVGETDPLNADTDADGVSDSVDALPLDPTETLDFENDGIGDNADPDDDNDGMPDSFEVTYVLNPFDASDALLDADNDGYNNLAEFRAGTNPQDNSANPGTVEYLHYKILANDGEATDSFGVNVSVDGNTALIGASYDDDNGVDSGAAYVYVQDANGNWIQQAKLLASDGASLDLFGYSVSLSGDTALIGSYLDYDLVSSGSAYVFVRDTNGNWTQQAKLLASDRWQDDNFGYSVSLSGDTALIGARYDDNTTGQRDLGSAYIFVRDINGSWAQQAKLTASDGAADDRFGDHVSLSENTALIGAQYNTGVNGTESGSAYVFVRDANGNWSEQSKLIASDETAYFNFGSSVSVSGNTALIGSRYDGVKGYRSGSAYMFERDVSGNWTQHTKLIPSDGAFDDEFGFSASLSGNTAMVGVYRDDDNGASTGSAYVYVRDSGGTWTLEAKLTASDGSAFDSFGYSVSLSGDVLLMGAYRDGDNGVNAGSAYLFNFFDADTIPFAEDNCPLITNQNQLDSDVDGAGDACDAFPLDPTETLDTDTDGIGNNVDNDDDGDGLLDTAEDINGNGLVDAGETDSLKADTDGDGVSDSIDVYPLDPAESYDTDSDSIGNNADPDDDNDGMPDTFEILYGFNALDLSDAFLDADGDSYNNLSEFLAGTNPQDANVNPGTVEYIHYKILANDGVANDEFGYSVSLSGNTALIGASGDDTNEIDSGSAYVYVQDGSGAWIQQAKLISSDGEANDHFGYSVSLFDDTALIGAYGDDDDGANAGAAYVFVRDASGNWTQQAKLKAINGRNGDYFGDSVFLSGDTALIGASGEDLWGFLSGGAYIFERDTNGNWTQQAALYPSGGAAYDYFGTSLSLSGDTALIGAYGDNDGVSAGAAYVFVRDQSGFWGLQTKLIPGDGQLGDAFGASVSLSGDTVLIGANLDDDNGSSSGSAYVYVRDASGNWSQQAKLLASDGVGGDSFGLSVSLSDDMAVIGAYWANYYAADSGSAYVYLRDVNGNWTQQAKLVANDGTAVNWFGSSVSLSSNKVLMGAFKDDDSGLDSGAAYLFELFDADTIPFEFDNCPRTTNQDQLDSDGDGVGDACDAFPLDPAETLDTDGDGIGNNVDNDDDGDGLLDTAEDINGNGLVDAGETDSLKADTDGDGVSDSIDVYPLDPAESYDTDSDSIGNNADPDDDNDGMPDSFEITYGFNTLDASDASLDADSDGYNNLSEFRAGTYPTNAGIHPGTVEHIHYKLLANDGAGYDFYGLTVSISGNTALIGAGRDDDNGSNSGSAYVYVRDINGNWAQQAKLTASDGEANDLFGYSVSLFEDTALIGAYLDDDSGSAYVFVRDTNGNWSQQAKLVASDGVVSNRFGFSVSLSGNTALIGAERGDGIVSESGAAYVFVRDASNNWLQQAKLFDSTGAFVDKFGASVSLSGDTALIGAYYDDDNGSNAGSAFIYQRDANGNWLQQAKLIASSVGVNNENFGYSVSLSGDTALIGVIGDDSNGYLTGSAYIFVRDVTGNWSQQAKLFASDGEANDNFGISVAISDSTALISATVDDDNGISSGSAYVFVHDASGNWNQLTKLVANDGASSDYFGTSVGISGDTALIGAYGDDDNGVDSSGSVYLFNLFDDDDIPYAVDNCPLTTNQDQLNSDGDSAGDACDVFPLDPAETLDTDGDGTGNNADTDDDNDGLLDTAEDINGNGLVDAGETDPLNADTDGDGYTDGEEVSAGSDPLDSNSIPSSSVYGDLTLDGVVDVRDVLLAQQVLHGQATLTTVQFANADVAPLVGGVPSPDGFFNAADLLLITRKALGAVSY